MCDLAIFFSEYFGRAWRYFTRDATAASIYYISVRDHVLVRIYILYVSREKHYSYVVVYDLYRH